MADIKRIYEIEVQGVKRSLEELSTISTTFDTLDLQVKELKKQLNLADVTSNSTLVESLKKQIKSLEDELSELTKKKSALTKETVLLNQAEKEQQTQTQATSKAKQEMATAQSAATTAVKENTEASKQNIEQESEEEEKYKTLSQRINDLVIAREQLRTEGKPIIFEDIQISDQQAIAQIQNLKALQSQLKQEIDAQNESVKNKNISTEKGIGLLGQELRQLQLIVSATREGDDVTFKGKILSYEQAIQKINELKAAQQSEIDIQKNLTISYAEETNKIADLTQKEKDLEAAIAAAKKTTISPFSPQLGVSFDNQIITLKEAEKIQEQIGSDIINHTTLLNEVNRQQSEINSKTEQEEQIRKANLVAEEGSVTNLKNRIIELNTLINSRSTSTTTPISFEGEVLSLNQAVEKRNQLNALLETAKFKVADENIELAKQLSEYDQLIAKRKDLENLTASAQLGKRTTVEFDNQVISIDSAIRKIQEMKIQEQNLIDQFKIEKGVHDAINLSEQNSITSIREQASALKTVLDNRNQNATSVSFNNQTLSIQQAQEQLALYQKTIQTYNEQERLRKQAIDAVNGSMRQMQIETNQLTQANNLLTASNKEVGLSLNAQQWNAIRTQIGSIVPELNTLTLEQVNAGRASEILTQRIFENNAALRDFKLQMSGSNTLVGDYTKGIVDAFKNLGLSSVLTKEKVTIDGQIRDISTRINDLKDQWQKGFSSGSGGLEKIEQELKDAAVLHTQLTSKVGQLNTAFQATETIGNQVTTGISQGFKNLDQTIGRTLFTYVGFQAAISGVTRLIQVDKQLSDQSADLRRTLGATAEETNKVTDALKQLDTRTSITQLQSFAVIAARAGVATENIAGVTAAINKLQLVAGSELGDIDNATTSIVKLINIFEGAGHTTEESVLRVGNALVKLSNEGVASGKFLINFSERLAGIRGATGISQASVLGLAAAFEETGQTSEIAATSVSQVLNKISADVPKFAQLAGKAVEEFRATLRANPAEALIQLAEGLRKSGTAADEMGAEFDKLGLTGVRIRNTLQDVGANSDFFRKRINDATAALVDQNTILTGSEQKQQTFAATLDKISASLTKAFDNQNFVKLLDSIGSALLGIINTISRIPFGLILTGISLITAAWAVYKGQVISTTLAEAALNKQSALNIIARQLERIGIINVTAAQKLKVIQNELEVASLKQAIIQRELAAGASEAEATATAEAAVATTALNTAIKLSPIGIFLGILALILPALGAFASKTTDATNALSRQNQVLKANLDLSGQINEDIKRQTQTTIDKVKQLIEVIKDETLTLGTRKVAYQQLISLAPEFQKSIRIVIDEFGNEKIAINDLLTTYDDFIRKINDLAKAKALATVGQRVNEDLIQKQLEEEQAKAEALIAQQKFADDQAKHLGVTGKKNPLAQGDIEADKQAVDDANKKLIAATQSTKQQEALLKSFNALRESNTKSIDASIARINEQLKSVVKGSQQEKDLLEQKSQLDQQRNEILQIQPQGEEKNLQYYIDLYNQLTKEIQEADKNSKKIKEGTVQAHEQQLAIEDLRKQRAEVVRKIKELGGIVPGSKTGGTTGRVQVERDEFNEIEAIRARDIAEENLRFAKITEIRKATLDEEISHLKTLQEINDTADNSKIVKLQKILDVTLRMQKTASGKRLDQLKSDAIREEKDIAEAGLAISTRQVQINDQILALKQKRLEEEVRIEKKDLDRRKSELQLTFETVSQSPDSSNEAIAEAHKEMDDAILAETISHYDSLIALAQSFNLSSEALEDEKNKAVHDALKLSLQDDLDLYEAFFKDVDKTMQINIIRINDKLNTLREQVLSSNKTEVQKSQDLRIIDDMQRALDAAERLQDTTTKYKKALDDVKKVQDEIAKSITNPFDSTNGSIGKTTRLTDEQIAKLHEAVVAAKIDLKDALDTLNQGINDYSNASNTITSTIANLFSKIFKVSDADIADPKKIAQKIALQGILADTIAQTFSVAKDALNNYFDAEKQRIEDSNQLIKDRLDFEFQQRIKRAQSQAEEDALSRELAQKKKDEDRKAFEDEKKLRIGQAKINYGMELSNIALIAFAPTPQNVLTAGAFGAILYAIQAAFATIRYISNVSTIQAAQFTGAHGLQADRDTIRGGHVKGRSHTHGGNPFLFHGRVFEDEVDEINVIRTKNAPKGKKYKVEGTQSQIASFLNVIGGGISFDPGAMGSRLEFGGNLRVENRFQDGGSVFTLQPPSNPSQLLNTGGGTVDSKLRSVVLDITNQVAKINNKVDQQTDNLNLLAYQTNTRIDKIKVIAVAKEIETVNNNTKKAISIGTIGTKNR